MGITPAWAGKRFVQPYKLILNEDHPRVGGEKSNVPSLKIMVCGSPPRGRGKASGISLLSALSGITPAWAGKRILRPPTQIQTGDHPRVGGEKKPGVKGALPPLGSPPRGRGKEAAVKSTLPPEGITPAWAGKRKSLDAKTKQKKDHPRVGGEKTGAMQLLGTGLGSPPRGRGKVLCRRSIARRYRITPAWAGKRLKRSHRSGIFISGPIPFHSVLHRPAGSGGSRAGRDGSPAGQPQNAGPA